MLLCANYVLSRLRSKRTGLLVIFDVSGSRHLAVSLKVLTVKCKTVSFLGSPRSRSLAKLSFAMAHGY